MSKVLNVYQNPILSYPIPCGLSRDRAIKDVIVRYNNFCARHPDAKLLFKCKMELEEVIELMQFC